MIVDKKILTVCFFLAISTLTVYWQAGSHEFLYLDDNSYITENSHIRDGVTVRGLYWAFTTGYAANWHPLTWISHMLDVQLFGLNAGRHHLTNLLFHVANVLLLFFVLHRMTNAFWRSAFVAALFALHPLHVESVAWVSERKDVLSTLFLMLTLIAYGNYARKPHPGNYLAVLVFFALGLMAKPMLVTLPFALLLLDYWPLERLAASRTAQPVGAEAINPVATRKRKGKGGKPAPKTRIETEKPTNHRLEWASLRPLILEKIPLVALAAFSCAATYIAQSKGGAVGSTQTYTPGIRMANAFVSYLLYIVKTILPINLAAYYPYSESLPLWQVFVAILSLAAVTVAVFRKAGTSPYLPVGWLWFTGTLVPVIGIVQVGDQAMADRYTYIPSIGLFIMAAWGAVEIFRKRSHGKEFLAASAALSILCIFTLTWKQVGYWRDSITLFDHTLSVTKNNYLILSNRGYVLENLGNRTRALEDFDRSLAINPGYVDAYNNRGIIYDSMGSHARAIDDFNKAIAIDPGNAPAYNNRGAAYMALGDPGQAIEDYNMAIGIDPNYANAHYNRGVYYQSVGKYRQAIDDYDRAIETNQLNKAEVFCNRGAAYAYLGDQKTAIRNYDKAIELDPDHTSAYFNRAVAYGELGDQARAINDYGKTIALNPESPKAYFNRGMAYESLGRKEQAIEDLKTAAKLGYEDAKNYLRSQGVNK